MALIHSQTIADKTYQVRTAGNSVRLYTNGVFHSQYNSRRPFMGHVWDLMALPILPLLQFKQQPKILLLGLGGGAVVKQIKALCPGCDITAVELDKTHINLAKKYFLVNSHAANVVNAEAQAWIKCCKQKFDIIIDDLFGESAQNPQQPERAIELSPKWIRDLNARLKPGGSLVFNTESAQQINLLIKVVNELNHNFKCLHVLSVRSYENRMAFISERVINKADFYLGLQSTSQVIPKNLQENYIIRSRKLRRNI